MTVFPELSPFPIIMALPFAVTLLALHLILLKPLMAYLDERQRTVSGARKEAGDLAARVEERLASVDERLKAARAEAAALRKEARDRANLAANDILSAARTKAEARVAEATTQIAAQEREAADNLRAPTESLSQEIVTSVLGRAVA